MTATSTLTIKDSNQVGCGVINDKVDATKLKFLEEDPVGSGAFGDVYNVNHKDWGIQLAYKKLPIRFIKENNPAGQRLVQSLKKEADIHRAVRHPNIVSMLGIVFERENYGILLEFVEYGSLHSFLQNIRSAADDIGVISISIPWNALKCKFAREISSGMSYLHTLSTPLIHGDLKLQNVLIDEHLNAKISDFGLSNWKNYSRTSSTQAGSIRGTASHIPPEKWKTPKLKPNEAFDVYGFGILVWELFTEQTAFEDSPDMICSLVVGGKRPPITELPSDIPPTIKKLIIKCWNQLPDKRPTFTRLMKKLNMLVSDSRQIGAIRKAKTTVYEILRTQFTGTDPSVHAEKMERCCQRLGQLIRRTDEILGYLLEGKALNIEEHDLIRSEATTHELIVKLIHTLGAKDREEYECFLNALDKTDQHHLYRLLEEQDYDLEMNHKAVIIDNYTFLKNNIDLSAGILDLLITENVLNAHELEMIRAERTGHEKIERLLLLMMRTRPEQYEVFLKSLLTARQEFIVERLRKAAVGISTVLDENDMKLDPESPDCPARKRFKAVHQDLHPLIISRDSGGSFDDVDGAGGYYSPGSISSDDDDLEVEKLHRIDVGISNVWGVALLRDNIMVICESTNDRLFVFDSTSFKKLDEIILQCGGIGYIEEGNPAADGVERDVKVKKVAAWDIAACNTTDCLYIVSNDSCIWRLSDKQQKLKMWLGAREKWRGWHRLSVTSKGHVLLLDNEPPKLLIYSSDTVHLATIELPVDIKNPRQALETASSTYVISHGLRDEQIHRVCELTKDGHVIRSYGSEKGGMDGQLNQPVHVTVDFARQILFIADCSNNRVVLLNSQMSLCHVVDCEDAEVTGRPSRVFYHHDSRRMMLGLEKGHIDVFKVSGLVLKP